MQLCANKLDKKDFFGKSDPFLVFYRSNEDGTWVSVIAALSYVPCLAVLPKVSFHSLAKFPKAC